MNKIYRTYQILLTEYGPQGWWPLVGCNGTNPTKTGTVRGYHVGNYSFPHNRNERFEICVGAILTQNTNWQAVEKSLLRLNGEKVLSPEVILGLDIEKLKELIRPSGYHNQKSRYLKGFAGYFIKLEERVPSRNELLGLLGVGPETADSMLLYAFRQPEFVIDAYTKRIFAHLGLIGEKEKYDVVKSMCEKALRCEISDSEELLIAYQEFHALLVEHAKRFYSRKPFGVNDDLRL